MVKIRYIPNKGDLVKINFAPQSGHEQAGWRPGLVISNKTFNRATGFIVVCPITNTNRSYPFHIPLLDTCSVTGVIMVDQAKSLDYKSRKACKIDTVSEDILVEVMARHSAIFQDDGEL